LPYYAGHHYFALPHEQRAESRLSMPPSARVRQKEDGSLTGTEPGDSTYSIADPRLQDTFHLLQAAGSVGLAMPSTIDIELFTEGKQHALVCGHHMDRKNTSDFYCVEPWLGLPNAIARARTALARRQH
jgi:aldose 1-epimerase